MAHHRRTFLAGALAAFAAAATPAMAQNYPSRPITVIIPFAGGSASDVFTRIMLDRMATAIGQPFVIDNRPGAGGNTGTGYAAKQAPDGYTLVMTSSGPLAANRSLVKDLGYDPEKDFEPISLFAIVPNIVVVNANLPIKTLKEFIDYAKQRPKELNYGTVGVGSSQHLAAIYFEQVTGTQLTHVPYRNIAQYTPDFLAGAVPTGFQLFPNVSGMLSTGQARALAVTSAKRMTALPDVPTSAEAGLEGYETFGWFAFLAPKGTPKEVVDKINDAVKQAAADPEVRTRITNQGAELMASSPEELSKFIVAETKKWREILQKAGIQPQ